MLATIQGLFEASWPFLALLLVGAAILRAARQAHDDSHFGDRPIDVPTRARRTQDAWPYRLHPVLTTTELEVMVRLREAFPDRLVLARVPVAAVLEVTCESERREWLHRIGSMSFDFLVCEEDSMPRLAIDLDDASHCHPNRKSLDAVENRICQDAGLHLVRFSLASPPTTAELRALMLADEVSPQSGGDSSRTPDTADLGSA